MQKLKFWLNRVPNWVLYVLGAIPVFWLFAQGVLGKLGPDPISVLEKRYGLWALWLLIATLAITPLKSMGFNITKWRRPLGVLSFFYALAHMLSWLILDQNLVWARIWLELVKRPFITIGMVAFLLMLPLALTSNNRALRRLGLVRWRALHKLIYPIALLVPVHYLMVVKGFPIEPFLYFAAIVMLLALRIEFRANIKSTNQ